MNVPRLCSFQFFRRWAHEDEERCDDALLGPLDGLCRIVGSAAVELKQSSSISALPALFAAENRASIEASSRLCPQWLPKRKRAWTAASARAGKWASLLGTCTVLLRSRFFTAVYEEAETLHFASVGRGRWTRLGTLKRINAE